MGHMDVFCRIFVADSSFWIASAGADVDADSISVRACCSTSSIAEGFCGCFKNLSSRVSVPFAHFGH